MTTERQAREALTVLLASVRVEGHHLDRAEDARKTLIDFITQAAEDKRIADAVRGGERFWQNAWGESVDGKVTINRVELIAIPASVLECE